MSTPAATTRPVHYNGWWEVPEYLLTATTLAELEFPRAPGPSPAAYVEDHEGWHPEVKLYDVRTSPPTKATAAQLDAAQRKSTRPRACSDCPAQPWRPLTAMRDGRHLCHTCLHITHLRAAQKAAGEKQAGAAAAIAAMLTRPQLALVTITAHNPGPTSSGNARPNTACSIAAVDAGTGKPLLDLTVSLAGPNARIVYPGAIPRDQGREQVTSALRDRPPIFWDRAEYALLIRSIPFRWPRLEEWPRPHLELQSMHVANHCTHYRAQINTSRSTVSALHPGTLDRLLLHLRRIAATTEPEQTPAQHAITAGQPA